MENVIITVICIAILLTGTTAFGMSALNSLDTLSDSMREQMNLISDIRMTSISSVRSSTEEGGGEAYITIRNDGQTSLASFSKWDVIIQYTDGQVQWLPYGLQTPGWTVDGIYMNGNPEIFEPNIFNAHETMDLNLKLSPPVSDNSTNLANIVTPNGMRTSVLFGTN